MEKNYKNNRIQMEKSPYSHHFLNILTLVLEDKSLLDFTFEEFDHLHQIYKSRQVQKLFARNHYCYSIRGQLPQKFSLTTIYQIARLKKTFYQRSSYVRYLLNQFYEEKREERNKNNQNKEDLEDNISSDFQIPITLLEAKPYEIDEPETENQSQEPRKKIFKLAIRISANNVFIHVIEFFSLNAQAGQAEQALGKQLEYLSGGTLAKKHKIDQALKNKKKTKVDVVDARVKNKRAYRKDVEELVKNLLAKYKNQIESSNTLIIALNANQEDRDPLVQPLTEHVLSTYKTQFYMDLLTFKVYNGCKGRKRPNK